jgi:hypothetical protein
MAYRTGDNTSVGRTVMTEELGLLSHRFRVGVSGNCIWISVALGQNEESTDYQATIHCLMTFKNSKINIFILKIIECSFTYNAGRPNIINTTPYSV